jgi:methylated-DNA-[protein]-cysteine S-methyltransferase
MTNEEIELVPDELLGYRTIDPAVDRAAAEASERLAERAWTEGGADVAYATADSPFGPLLVAMTRRGLGRLAYPTETPDEVLQELSSRLSPRMVESMAATDQVRRELDEYFAGRLHDFTVRVDLSLVRGFTLAILRATSRIPFGSVSTYREVATKAGNAAAVRAAGNALGSNPIPIVVPCHRVLRTGGGLGGYTGGLDCKVKLLQLEGVDPDALWR